MLTRARLASDAIAGLSQETRLVTTNNGASLHINLLFKLIVLVVPEKRKKALRWSPRFV
jgi:hypothetical protein